MWKRFALFWTLFRTDARQLLTALRHPDCPAWAKWGTALVLLYVLSPIDLIPDWIPFFGWLDDIAIATFAIRFMVKRLPPHVLGRSAQ